MANPTCHACGGRIEADTITCPHCRADVRHPDASGTANVIALLVVIAILVIVGHDALAPSRALKPVDATPRPTAPAQVKPTRLMEHAPASSFARGMENARRALSPLRH